MSSTGQSGARRQPPADELAERLRLIEACGELCRQMLGAAGVDDWREVHRLEQHRRQLARQLRFDSLPADQAERLLPAMRRLVEQTGALDELARVELSNRSRALAQGRQSAGAIAAYADEQHGFRGVRGPGR